MEKNRLSEISIYKNKCIMLTTKHAKSLAIGPHFAQKLGASIIEYVVDTDKLGTFSGEIERLGSPVECARKKCEWALELSDKVEFALASEGSFGPHPLNPFMPCDREIIYFIDRKHNFHLHLCQISEKTNYNQQTVSTLEQLLKFAQAAQFPSHALILRPYNNNEKILFKGITSLKLLKQAFSTCLTKSSNSQVLVETDMRAQYNPLRMSVISELAAMMAKRLATPCPQCFAPGWGKIRHEPGLSCRVCKAPTALIKFDIWGCVLCKYEQISPRADGLTQAEPGQCEYCNP